MIEYDAFDAIKDNDLKALESFAASIESGGWAWSPLHEAAKLGRTELLILILKQRSSVHINDDFEIGEPDDFRSGTALTEALINGHVDTAIFLIEQGANVNATYYGYENTHCLGLEIEESGTCLTLAIEIGNDELIQLMIKHGLDISETFQFDHKDMTAFAYYLECADIEALQKLFDLGADITALVKDEWDIDITPLMQAIRLYNPYHQTQGDSTRKNRLAVVDW
ncbi:MAG: ankyrin repeat domain-containing protein, partial [Methylobacter sp.]